MTVRFVVYPALVVITQTEQTSDRAFAFSNHEGPLLVKRLRSTKWAVAPVLTRAEDAHEVTRDGRFGDPEALS